MGELPVGIGGINLVGCCAALVAFLAFAPAAGSQDWEQEKAKYEEHLEHLDHEHRFVKITEGNLRPDVLRIGPDESVGWLYYGGHSARVSFDKKVAESVTCSAPGAFRIDGDRIQSRPLKRYEFVSFCMLKPGEYVYRVDMGGPPLTAKVIVE